MRRIILFLFLSICSLVISSCDTLTQKRFEFFYYPSKNIYYDVAGKFYLYSLDGGSHWDSVKAISTAEPATLGNKEIIYSPTPAIWLQNDDHVKQYNAHVIHIAGIDTGLSNKELVAERKAKKVRMAANMETTKEPEKKPGFFKRLFGKKDK
ncbi:MAG TPA: hypothetical protein VFW07_07890 [Parafilimonas sp.]|nr:hypothetical protein [Parafilimonas sp.]